MRDPDMLAYHVGGKYDRPIARRLAEEAGAPRGTFARPKRAEGVFLQHDGSRGFSLSTLQAIERFAAAEGRTPFFPRRSRIGRRHRPLIRLAYPVGAGRLVAGLERRRRTLVHFDPALGTLL